MSQYIAGRKMTLSEKKKEGHDLYRPSKLIQWTEDAYVLSTTRNDGDDQVWSYLIRQGHPHLPVAESAVRYNICTRQAMPFHNLPSSSGHRGGKLACSVP